MKILIYYNGNMLDAWNNKIISNNGGPLEE
jgi:hypothetical protein